MSWDMTEAETKLLVIVSKMHVAWMQRDELMRQAGGFALMERMANLMDQIVDAVPTLVAATHAALAQEPSS